MSSRREQSDRSRFHLLLRQIRIDQGWTQAELADRLGQPQSFVSKYESGERRIDFLELRQICRALSVELSDFIRRFEEGDL